MLNSFQIGFLVVAYLIAAIPFGVVFSRLFFNQDVRKQGSGNIGATNVARMMGKKWGIVVLICDALKGYLVVCTAYHIGNMTYVNIVAVVAVVAHCYPVYLRFKGGKGVATALGVIAAVSPVVIGAAVLVFALTVGITRIISAASLTAALSIPLLTYVLPGDLLPLPALVIAAIVWWKHKENVKRLIAKQEPKFF